MLNAKVIFSIITDFSGDIMASRFKIFTRRKQLKKRWKTAKGQKLIQQLKNGELTSKSSADQHTDFRRAVIPNIDLHHTVLENFDFGQANLKNANFEEAEMYGIRLSGANLQKANFTGAKLEHANFNGADLTEACFRDADLSKADLRYASVKKANFDKATLEQCSVLTTDVKHGDFKRPKVFHPI